MLQVEKQDTDDLSHPTVHYEPRSRAVVVLSVHPAAPVYDCVPLPVQKGGQFYPCFASSRCTDISVSSHDSQFLNFVIQSGTSDALYKKIDMKRKLKWQSSCYISIKMCTVREYLIIMCRVRKHCSGLS